MQILHAYGYRGSWGKTIKRIHGNYCCIKLPFSAPPSYDLSSPSPLMLNCICLLHSHFSIILIPGICPEGVCGFVRWFSRRHPGNAGYTTLFTHSENSIYHNSSRKSAQLGIRLLRRIWDPCALRYTLEKPELLNTLFFFQWRKLTPAHLEGWSECLITGGLLIVFGARPHPIPSNSWALFFSQ